MGGGTAGSGVGGTGEPALGGAAQVGGGEALGSGGAASRVCVKVDGEQARSRVAAGAFLLDVRTPEEFTAGHIEGATNIPLDQLGGRLGDVPSGAVVVYCRSGNRSGQAATLLCDAGYDVYDLGPMTAW